MSQRCAGKAHLGAQTVKQGTTMFNLDIFKANSRRAAVALGAIVGAVTFSAPAGAGPPPLFSFVLTPPGQTAPPLQAPPFPGARAAELPGRLWDHRGNSPHPQSPGPTTIRTP